MTSPRVTISILAHNRKDCSEQCINSVLAGRGSFELILTNNASTDGTAELFEFYRKRFGDDMIKVVHNRENLFFIEPNRRAFGMARGEFFVMLNNDTRVPPGWLDVLMQPFADDKVALVGPHGHNCSIAASFHGFSSPRFEYLEGSCLMGRSSILRMFGLFSDYLQGGYGEDSDLSLRMREAGFKLCRVPLKIFHLGSATTKMVPSIRRFQSSNHSVLRQRWSHYLKVRKMDYPIVLRRNGAIGDVLLTTPIIRWLTMRKPVSPIIVETSCPNAISLPREWNVTAVHARNTPRDALVYTLDMAYENRPGMRYVDAYAKVLGIDTQDPLFIHRPEFVPSVDAMRFASSQITCPTVALHIGPTAWPGRNWPIDRWRELELWFINDLRMRCIRLGGPPHCNMVTTVDELGAVLRRCALFVGIDSFPMHMACAAETRIVALFGVTSSRYVLPPYGPHIGLCGDAPCAGERHRVSGKTFVSCDGACMRAISVEMVKDACMKILDKEKGDIHEIREKGH